jgi:peptide/nickel transport system ATP-binding protein/oligopeptide transport system ATP-binding protein
MSTVAASNPLVSVEHLRVQFLTSDKETVKAVDGVTFNVSPGETFGVIGESGSGKSTLGRALVGLLKPTEGTIRHDGVDPNKMSSAEFRKHRRDYQIIFQDPSAALNPRRTILQSVCEPLEIIGELPHAEIVARATKMLTYVGLGHTFLNRYPHQLSGGQKQRVNIARALMLQPKLLVCDEIIAALDVSIQADILNLLAQLQRDFELTFVFITHDLGVVSHISDRIAVMYLGTIVELGRAEDMRDRPRHPYTEALLSAEPSPMPSTMRESTRIILEGEIPSPISPPSGCRFRTRCRYAQPVCAEKVPAFREVEPNRWAACHFAETLVLQSPETVQGEEVPA